MDAVISSGNLESLKILLNENPQEDLDYALQSALLEKQHEMVKYLIECGAEVDVIISNVWEDILNTDLLPIVLPLITDYRTMMIIQLIKTLSPEIYKMVLPCIKILNSCAIKYKNSIFELYIFGNEFITSQNWTIDTIHADHINECIQIFAQYGGHVFNNDLDLGVQDIESDVEIYLDMIFTQHPNISIPTVINELKEHYPNFEFFNVQKYLIDNGFIKEVDIKCVIS